MPNGRFKFNLFPISVKFVVCLCIANNMEPDQTAPAGSSLIRVHSVCFHDKIWPEVQKNKADKKSRRRFQDKKVGVIRVNHCSPVENQNDPELDFKVFFFVDSCWRGIVLDESN